MNNETINLFLLGGNIIWGIINTVRTRTLEASQKYAPQLIDEIFKPHYQNIECQLFIPVTIDNKEMIHDNLINLYLQIKEKNLLFYISDDLLISLEELISVGQQKDFNKRSFNKLYQRFSSYYYLELNRFRKIVGLKRRGIGFRVHHKLYRYKIHWYLLKYVNLLQSIVVLIIILIIELLKIL